MFVCIENKKSMQIKKKKLLNFNRKQGIKCNFHLIYRILARLATTFVLHWVEARCLCCSPTIPFLHFRFFPFHLQFLRESFLFCFPLATKIFQLDMLSIVCPWFNNNSTNCHVQESNCSLLEESRSNCLITSIWVWDQSLFNLTEVPKREWINSNFISRRGI